MLRKQCQVTGGETLEWLCHSIYVLLPLQLFEYIKSHKLLDLAEAQSWRGKVRPGPPSVRILTDSSSCFGTFLLKLLN